MSNLALLMKNNLINESGINKLKYADKNEKLKAFGMALLIIFTMVILSIYGFILCFYLSDFLISINQMELLLVLGILGCTITTFFTSLYKSPSYLFQSKDYEILSSLPIREGTILGSKILTLIISNYLFAAAFLIVPGIVYFIKVKTSVLYFPFLIILTLIVPLIPITFSSIVAFFITNISTKAKKSNLVSIILNLSLVVIVLIISLNLQNVMTTIIQNSNSIIDGVQKIYPPAYYFVDALKRGNIASLLIFTVVSIIPISLLVSLFAKNFDKINSRLSETYKANDYKFRELKLSSPVKSLLSKETKRFLSSNIYVMNSSVGMIMLPIFTIAILVVGYDKIAQILEISMFKDMILLQILGIISFCLVLTNTTCVSISLEGKNLWILKSSPIEEMDIFKSKILVNIILTIPISIVSFIALSFKLDFSIIATLLIIVAIILLAIFSATLGIIINLLYPKLEFTSDVAVVKRGASVIITMISNGLYLVALCGIGYIFKIDNINLFLIIVNVITLIGVFLLYGLLKTKGVNMFRNL